MAQQHLLKSGRSCKFLSGSFHAEHQVRAPAVIKANPIADDAAGMLQRLEPRPVHALLFNVRITRLTILFAAGSAA